MPDEPRWTDRLADEDLSFIKRFVLASGSLKAIATEYGISYPTVRLRLDRLIEKIKVYDSLQIRSEFERLVRALCADGRIDAATMKQLLTVHQQEVEAVRELDGGKNDERKDQR
jgi:hypothetical protein